ncbi:MAG: GIY-YIG nuclease family protein [Oscillospiraceae bacterium]|nr:GIY-YIG nuclease family protein [Oscillospiraceae bacterium]
MSYYVYMLTNSTNVVLYTGVTGDLIRRVYEHKNELDPDSFTARYKTHKLVWYEYTEDVRAAIEREKQIKSRSRKYKNALVEIMNPKWEDLYPGLCE